MRGRCAAAVRPCRVALALGEHGGGELLSVDGDDHPYSLAVRG